MTNIIAACRRYAPRLVGYTGVQVLVQVMNAATGFFLVRSLDKNEYAWFTIANSLLATINIMADSGLGSATTSLGGPICHDREKFAGLVGTTRRLRHVFALTSAVVVLPAGWWVLSRNSAPTLTTALLLVITLMSAVPAAETVVLSTVNRLHSRLRFMLQGDLTVSSSRLVLTSFAWLAGINAMLAAGATAAAQWLQTLLLRRQTRDLLHGADTPDPSWHPRVMEIVRHFFPLCVFQCVQGHLTTWLLSVFATTHDVADVGALSRLAIVFTFMGLPLGHLIAPAIARCTDARKLARWCVGTVVGYSFLAGGVAMSGMLLSPQVLWILGDGYVHLHAELGWYLISAAAGLLSTVLWGVVLARSWLRLSWLHIPITLLLQLAAVFWLDLSRVIDVIVFSSISSLAGIAVCMGLMIQGVRKFAMQSPEMRMRA